ncbi:hypothetical protein, partial [Porphyromonas sp.]|uniref:hypothetical protein n=1 Tax=Porphyromonas sp. TaxID=1924944 RepID=UPI0026DAE495
MFKKSLIIATLLGILLSVGCQDESVRPIPKKTPQEETSKDSDKKDTTKPEEEKSKDDQKPEDGDKP